MLDGAHLRDRLVASDPELARLRQASRATLTALLSTGVLHLLARAVGQPTAIGLVGINAAMMGTVIVHDRTPRDQRITSALVPVAASVALTLGTLAAPIAWLRDGLFLAVAFLAALAGARGPRGVALGMIGFLAYFSALFFHANLAQLPLMIAGIFVAAAIAYVVRYRVLRERPAALVRQRHEALRRRLAIVLYHCARAIEAGQAAPRRVLAVRRALAAVNESALAIDEQLAVLDARDPVSEALRSRVFALELAVAELVAAVRALLTCPDVPVAARDTLARELLAARAAVRDGAANRSAHRDTADPRRSHAVTLASSLDVDTHTAPSSSPDERPDLAAHTAPSSSPDDRPDLATHTVPSSSSDDRPDVATHTVPSSSSAERPDLASPSLDPSAARALAAVRDALTDVLAAADPAAPTSPVAPLSAPEPPPPRPALRRAVQATTAAALALFAGQLASSTRGAWAVLAAFMVFTRATTLGAMLVRAWQRVLGTALGVVVGLFVAHAVQGHPRLELAFVFACLFVAYYFLQTAYAFTVAAFTTLIAALYSLLGRFTPDLLYLRVIETLIGAGIGAGVAALVFPTRTRERIRGAMATALRSLADFLDTAVVARSRDRAALQATARTLDRSLREIRTDVDRAGWTPLLPPTRELAAAYFAFAAVFHHARTLAGADWSSASDEVSTIGAQLSANARTLADALVGATTPKLLSVAPAIAAAREPRPARALGPLARLDEALLALAQAVG